MNEHDTTEETDVMTASLEAGEHATAAASAEASDAASALPAPRTRWAAIIWGAVFAGIAAWALWTFGDVERRAGVLQWIGELSVASGVAYGLLALGALVLILGLIGVLRRAQRRGEQSPPAAPQ